MDLYYALAVMVMAWIFLILSFYGWREIHEWVGAFFSVVSMMFFFIAGQMMIYVTLNYVYITSTDVVGTGVIHLSEYQPYALLFYVFGMLALVWTFVIIFYDVVLPKLRQMGVV